MPRGLLGLLGLALALRLPGLTESLWFDEVYHTHVYWDDPARRQLLLGWEDVHPPLFAFLLLGWTRLVGDSELAVRLPSLLAGLASIALVWRLGRTWLGPRQGWLAAALLALSPVHIWFSRESKANMLMLCLGALAVWALWSAAETGLRRYWFLGSLALLLGLYNHAYALPIGVALFLWLGWRALSQRALRAPLALATLAVLLPWLPLAIAKFLFRGEGMDRWYLDDFRWAEAGRLLFEWLPHGNTLRGDSWFVDGIFALVFLRGLAREVRRAGQGHWEARLVLLWLFVPLLMTAGISLLIPHSYIERNMLAVLPPFVLLLAAGAVEVWAMAAVLGLTALGVLNLLVLNPDAPTVYHMKPDWRTAAPTLSGEIFVTVPTTELEYYPPQSPAVVHEIVSGKVLEDAERAGWRPLAPFFLVRNLTWKGCWNEVWGHWSNDPRFKVAEIRSFRGLMIYRFVPADRGAAQASVDFGGDGQKLLTAAGFWPGESAPDGTFAWSRGPASTVAFWLEPQPGPYRLTARARGPAQVSVSLNGKPVGRLEFPGGFDVRALDIQPGLLRQGANELGFSYDRVLPLGSGDPRSSSVCWDALQVAPAAR